MNGRPRVKGTYRDVGISSKHGRYAMFDVTCPHCLRGHAVRITQAELEAGLTVTRFCNNLRKHFDVFVTPEEQATAVRKLTPPNK